jgi:hypothetical protein
MIYTGILKIDGSSHTLKWKWNLDEYRQNVILIQTAEIQVLINAKGDMRLKKIKNEAT